MALSGLFTHDPAGWFVDHCGGVQARESGGECGDSESVGERFIELEPVECAFVDVGKTELFGQVRGDCAPHFAVQIASQAN